MLWQVGKCTRYIICKQLICLYVVCSWFFRIGIVETKPDSKHETLKPQIGALFHKSVKREYSVVFIVLTTFEETRDLFRTVIECNTLENMNNAKKKWTDQGFIDQKPTQTPCFKGFTRQMYKLKISKNVRVLEDYDGDYYLQFHPKRPNFIIINSSLKTLPKGEKGNVQVFETEKKVCIVLIQNSIYV